MTTITPNSLLNPTEKTIKNWNCTFIAVEGPNILDKLSLEDLAIPYESQYRSRIILKAGETGIPLLYGFIGKAVTFLMIKVTYDSENDPYYKYEQEKYNITYYFENDPVLRPLNRLMIMTGSADEKIPQIYLNNPLDYDVTLDVLHATVDSDYDLSGTTMTFGMGDLNDAYISGLTSGQTLIYDGTYWINISAPGNTTEVLFRDDNTLYRYNTNSGFTYANGILTVPNLNVTDSIMSDLIPDGDGTRSLGSATNQWKDLWLSGSTIYMDGTSFSLSGEELNWNGTTLVGISNTPNHGDLIFYNGTNWISSGVTNGTSGTSGSSGTSGISVYGDFSSPFTSESIVTNSGFTFIKNGSFFNPILSQLSGETVYFDNFREWVNSLHREYVSYEDSGETVRITLKDSSGIPKLIWQPTYMSYTTRPRLDAPIVWWYDTNDNTGLITGQTYWFTYELIPDSGTDGTSGSSGTNGTSGSSGISGTDGTSGSSGTDGTSGSSGTNGTSGSSGTNGTSGSSGTNGTSGTTPELTYISQYPLTYSVSTVTATTYSLANGGYYPHNAMNPSNSLTGSQIGNEWMTDWGTGTNQRFHIDLGRAKTIKRIYYENHHHFGGGQSGNVSGFTFWGSNSVSDFSDLIYSNDGTWTQLTTEKLAFEQHVASDVADPKYILVTNSNSYRYYAFKFANSWGDPYMGLRRIELQSTADYSTSGTNGTSGTSGISGVSINKAAFSLYRDNSSLFYINSNNRYSGSSESLSQDSAFFVTATGLTTVNLYMRQVGVSGNTVSVQIWRSADGYPYLSGSTISSVSSKAMLENTTQTYSFTGLTINQFDCIFIGVTPGVANLDFMGYVVIE